jgi:hypothetical protein
LWKLAEKIWILVCWQRDASFPREAASIFGASCNLWLQVLSEYTECLFRNSFEAVQQGTLAITRQGFAAAQILARDWWQKRRGRGFFFELPALLFND